MTDTKNKSVITLQWWRQAGMYHTTEFETDVRVNGKWVSAGVGAGGETFQVSGEYLAHTLRCGDRVCSLNANRSNTNRLVVEGIRRQQHHSVNWHGVFRGIWASLAVVCDKFTAACFHHWSLLSLR
jgi:hypothetical protein